MKTKQRPRDQKRTLTRRQLEVAKLMAVGISNWDIGKQLDISPKTVDSHRGSILRALRLGGNVDLARYALREGWVTLTDPSDVKLEPAAGAKLTFADLKRILETLTPEQLAAEVVWVGDERGGPVKRVWIAEEDWVENDGDCEPLSVAMKVDPEAAKDAHVYIRKGTPQLLVD